MKEDEEETLEITDGDVAEMMPRVGPYMGRLLASFDKSEHALVLMTAAAWAVWHIGVNLGPEVAREFAQNMADQATDITLYSDEDSKYDA